MRKQLVLACGLAVLAFSASSAKTLYVATNGDDENNDGLSAATPFATIQKAIDSTKSCDTVEIADGTYFITEPIRFDGKYAEIKSASMDPDKVIVDAQGLCTCVSNGLFNGAANQIIINSITFQNGYSSWVGDKYANGAAGIYSQGRALITNCVVRNCYRELTGTNCVGGGVYLNHSASAGYDAQSSSWGDRNYYPGIYDSVISNCAACCVDGSRALTVNGGGLACDNMNVSGVTIANCSITNGSQNSAANSTIGGGAYLRYSNITNSVFRDCEVVNPFAEDKENYRGGGGGAYVMGSNAAGKRGRLCDSLVCGNTAPGYGGGLSLGSNVDVIGCTIASNAIIQSKGTGQYQPGGGGIWISASSSINLKDCLIADNEADVGGSGGVFGGGLCFVSAGLANLTVDGCVFRGNVANIAGAIYSYAPTGPVTFTNCVIEGNSCMREVSAVLIRSGSQKSAIERIAFVDCLVVSNYNQRTASLTSGGGIFQLSGSTANRYIAPFLARNCLFAGNRDNVGYGWGIRMAFPDGMLQVPDSGRAVWFDHCTVVTNTMSANNARFVYFTTATGVANTRFTGCVFRGNVCNNGKNSSGFAAASGVTGEYAISNSFCDVEDGTIFAVTEENGNLSSGDVKFANEAALDFRPLEGSCLIDKGGAFEDWMGNGSSKNASRDMGDGRYRLDAVGKYGVKVARTNTNPRRYGRASDMGCFEYWLPRGIGILIR